MTGDFEIEVGVTYECGHPAVPGLIDCNVLYICEEEVSYIAEGYECSNGIDLETFKSWAIRKVE